ncbi:hypothetical protein HAZT_HAZT011942 [Hyalella azteca]|uniref:Uncharacterized protein n=1 Tax=Hyalella azteca TaxID=294128 RepID=A0A6A0H411_HYAAZ|nr:hypothetical protein HAZT_HAZT011942 [Hyalella azteca]
MADRLGSALCGEDVGLPQQALRLLANLPAKSSPTCVVIRAFIVIVIRAVVIVIRAVVAVVIKAVVIVIRAFILVISAVVVVVNRAVIIVIRTTVVIVIRADVAATPPPPAWCPALMRGLRLGPADDVSSSLLRRFVAPLLTGRVVYTPRNAVTDAIVSNVSLVTCVLKTCVVVT